MPDLVQENEILADLKISRKQLVRLIEDKRFPKPIQLGLRHRIWLRSVYEEVLENAQPSIVGWAEPLQTRNRTSRKCESKD